jgi:hypothetical protein
MRVIKIVRMWTHYERVSPIGFSIDHPPTGRPEQTKEKLALHNLLPGSAAQHAGLLPKIRARG